MSILISSLLFACTELPVWPGRVDADAAFAKGGGGKPSGPPPAVTTIDDTGDAPGMRSDGLGAYVDGECGVTSIFNLENGSVLGTILDLSADPGACSAARTATLRLLVRHLSDDPHVDTEASPLGEFVISGMKLRITNGVGVVNAPNPLPGTESPTSCFEVSKGGRISGRGLRFDALNFPGSNFLIVTPMEGGAFRIRTAAYPDNVGYCENNVGISFWHVSVDLAVTPK